MIFEADHELWLRELLYRCRGHYGKRQWGEWGFLFLISFNPVEDGVEEVAGFLILHCQLFYLGISAWFFRYGCLLYKALIKLFDEVVVVLEKFGNFHEGLNGTKCWFVLLFPFVEELFDVVVVIPLLDQVDKILAVSIELRGGHCHFQSVYNQLL